MSDEKRNWRDWWRELWQPENPSYRSAMDTVHRQNEYIKDAEAKAHEHAQTIEGLRRRVEYLE